MNNDNRIDIVFTGSPNLENTSGDGTGDFHVFMNDGNMNFTNFSPYVMKGFLKTILLLVTLITMVFWM